MNFVSGTLEGDVTDPKKCLRSYSSSTLVGEIKVLFFFHSLFIFTEENISVHSVGGTFISFSILPSSESIRKDRSDSQGKEIFIGS